jgi:hypothetical protein
MKNRLWLISILLFLLTVSVPVNAHAQYSEKDRADARRLINTFNDWAKSPFVPNDKVYAAIRKEIDSDIASHKQTPSQIFVKYSKTHAMYPKNLDYLFGYAYSGALTYADLGPSRDQSASDAYENLYTIICNKWLAIPHTYNWGRLLFIAHIYNPNITDQILIGNQLLAKDPNDDSMKYSLAEVLSNSKNVEDRIRARQIVESQVNLHHDKISFRYLDLVNGQIAFRTHDPKDCDLGIASFNKAIEKAPTAELKQYCEDCIRGFERGKQYYSTHH